jgi:O-antigen/teichoic acid export membrane protein
MANEKSFEYVEDIGFPLIALFNGFTIVALIDLGAPAWAVVGGAVAAAIIGGQLVTKRKNKLQNTTRPN